MIVDSSALMAILLEEAEGPRLRQALWDAERCAISAGSWIELVAVMTRRALPLTEALEHLRRRHAMEIVPVTAYQAEIGAAAYRRYGIGTDHSARLNYGDCFAYALAIERGEPLLFKGDDFNHTNVRIVSY